MAQPTNGTTSSAPVVIEYEEPQPQVSTGTDRYDALDRTLYALETGNIRDAAILCTSVMRDDRIKGSLGQRIGALLSKCLEHKPADERSESQTVADVMNGDDNAPGQWSTMFPMATLEQMLHWGIMLNFCVCEIVWYQDESGQQLPRLKVWHPQHVTWDWNTRSFWIQTNQGRVELPSVDKQPHGDGKWVVFTPSGYANAWLGGIILQLGRLYLERGWVKRDWSHQSEKHGMPVDKVKVPATATTAEKRAFFRKVTRRGSDTAVMVPQGADGAPAWDFELVEATGRTWEVFQSLKGELDEDIAVLINGQTMSTEGQGGLGAQEKPGQAVRDDIMRKDSALADVLYAQVVYWWALYNYGDGGLAPRCKFQVDPGEDQAMQAKIHLDQSNADHNYIQDGVLTPEEVAISRFGNGEYSLDTEIDVEGRKRIVEVSAEQMELEADKALERAKNPEQPLPGEQLQQPGEENANPETVPVP
jgi:phage gp29-like protein